MPFLCVFVFVKLCVCVFERMFELSAQLPRRNEINRTICARYAPNTSHKNTHTHRHIYIDTYICIMYMYIAYSHIVSYLSNLTRFGLRSSSGRSFSSHWHCAIKRYEMCHNRAQSQRESVAQDVRHIIITVLVISYTHTSMLKVLYSYS